MTIQTTLEPLLVWIEENKHTVLRIDDIAKRSGYSKWYLQRAFLESTGMSLATYCRLRRLSLAALAVKYSSLTLVDIAFYFQFDSQQTFIREFGRKWSMTPGDLRKKQHLEWHGFCPTLLRIDAFEALRPVFTFAPARYIYSREIAYSIEPHELDTHPTEKRKAVWDNFVENLPAKPEKIICLTGPIIERDKKEIAIHYRYLVSVVADEFSEECLDYLKPMSLCSDVPYARFEFNGHFSMFRTFIQYIYNRIIPVMNIYRADGDDIEVFFLNGRGTFGNSDGAIRAYYYIPVVKEGVLPLQL